MMNDSKIAKMMEKAMMRALEADLLGVESTASNYTSSTYTIDDFQKAMKLANEIMAQPHAIAIWLVSNTPAEEYWVRSVFDDAMKRAGVTRSTFGGIGGIYGISVREWSLHWHTPGVPPVPPHEFIRKVGCYVEMSDGNHKHLFGDEL